MNPAIYKIYQDFESRKAAKKVPLSKLFDKPKPSNMKKIIILIALALILIGCARQYYPSSNQVKYNHNMR